MDIESGFTYFYTIIEVELKNDEIPEDFKVEADDPSLKGRYRCCHALIDGNHRPDSLQLVETFDAKLFKQSSYVPSGQPPPEWARYGCRGEILNCVEALLRKQPQNKGRKFLVKVVFGAYIKIDEEDEAEGEEEGKSVPASTSAIEGLEKVSGLDRGEECVICLGGNLDKEKSLALKMPCGHIYHQDCIVEWLRKSHLCPLCRYTLPKKSK